MIETEITTKLDARTRLNGAGEASESTAQRVSRSPWFYPALIAAAYVLRKQIFSPAGLVFAAGFYAAGKVKAGALGGLVHEQATFTINKPVAELYDLWRDLEGAPRYMESIKSVKLTSGTTSHWVMEFPGGQTLEWDSELTAQEPGRRLAWRSIGHTPVPSAGQVAFEEAASGRGTVVRVDQEFLLPGGRVGAALGGLFTRTPGGYTRENLRHFKQLAEAGEIATTKGQPHGTRSAATPLAQALTGDREQQQTEPETGAIDHQAERQEVA